MKIIREWFCTNCKTKFESDHPRPNCQECGSVHVLRNNPTGQVAR